MRFARVSRKKMNRKALERFYQKKEKGMFTVEAVFVIPIMLLIIFAVIYLSVVHYQNVVAVAEATRSANRVASYWSYIGGDNPAALQTGENAPGGKDLITKKMYTDRSPYRFIIETGSAYISDFPGLGARRRNGQAYADARMSSLKFNAYSDGEQRADLCTEVGFLSSYVTVSVKKHYLNPLGSLLQTLGVGDASDYESKAEALITSPSEFIRNIDLIFEVGYFVLGS